MKIAQLARAGSRAELIVKVVEVVMSAEVKSARVCQVLVADESACVLCMVSGNQVDVMVPGALLQLHNVLLEAVPDHTGKIVLMLRLDRFSQCSPAPDAVMLVKLDKNISYVQHQLVEAEK
jgi:hypothetical protein